MRRLYVAPMDVYQQHKGSFSTHLTTHWLALYDPNVPGELARWESEGRPVVISTEFISEGPEEVWHTHPEVTVLPHPVWQGTESVSEGSAALPENQLNAFSSLRAAQGLKVAATSAGEGGAVLSGVAHLVDAKLPGIGPSDTVVDVHAKLAAIHPAFRLRPLR